MISRSRAFVVAVIVCLGTSVLCRGIQAAEKEAEKKIREALAKPATMIEFNETQFKDAIRWLADTHKINIEVDWPRIEEPPAHVKPDTPITRVLKGVSLGSALNLLLTDLNLTYVMENEVLLITSIERAQRTSTPRVYNVAGLLREADRDELTKAVELVLDPSVGSQDEKPVLNSSRMLIFRGKLILRGSQPEHERVTELLARLREEATDKEAKDKE